MTTAYESHTATAARRRWSRQGQTVAFLAGALGLAHRDDAEDEADDRRQPAEEQARAGDVTSAAIALPLVPSGSHGA